MKAQTQLPLTLSQAQHLAWLHQQPTPTTLKEALGRLQEIVRNGQEALENGQLVAAQTLLEDTHLELLVAMNAFELQPEPALQRALTRLKKGVDKRAFHIFADRVEVRVRSEVRGEWMLYSQHDYEAALRLAHELGCTVIHEEAHQLGLFELSRLNSGHSQDAGVC